MKLHDDTDAFSELVAATAVHMGLPEIYIEKDYWVTKALMHLSQSDHRDVTVFKGGTSLSKAYRIIDRFSEDIDLAIFADGKSKNVIKKLLKKVEIVVSQGLEEVDDHDRTSKGSTYRKTVHVYPRHMDGEDFGQASSELMVEVNSFTNPEPFEERELQTFIADMLVAINKSELIEEHGLQPFSIQVLSVERTLVEKILGVIKDSYDDDPATKLSVRIRHLYDICLILSREEHREFVKSKDFSRLCDRCIEDECGLFEDTAHLFDKPLVEAPIFSNFTDWKSSLEATYAGVFRDLVYRDLPSMDEIEDALAFIKKNL